MTHVRRLAAGAGEVNRRDLLRVGALAALTAPLVPWATACAQPSPTGPDPLVALADSARSDVAAAQAAATTFPEIAGPLTVIASARQVHLTALRREIDRANITPASSTTATTAATTSATPVAASGREALAELVTALVAAQRQAAGLVPSLPRYRAGLVGSVSAGCASLLEALD